MGPLPLLNTFFFIIGWVLFVTLDTHMLVYRTLHTAGGI